MTTLETLLSSTMLARVASSENEDSIIHGELYGTFGPTRDGTVDGHAVFTYKNCDSELPASDFFRGRLTEYNPQLFGQVVRSEQGAHGSVIVLKRPDNLTDSQSRVYSDQVKKLGGIISTETALEGGTVISTWFGTTEEEFVVTVLPAALLRSHSSQIEPGAVISVWVDISRTERETAQSVNKTYRLYADTLTYLRLPGTH